MHSHYDNMNSGDKAAWPFSTFILVVPKGVWRVLAGYFQDRSNL